MRIFEKFATRLIALCFATVLCACAKHADRSTLGDASAPAQPTVADKPTRIALAQPSQASTANAMKLVAAKSSGGMTALAIACGFGEESDISAARARGEASFAGEGIGAAEFDQAFDAGVAEAHSKMASVSEEQRRQACAQIGGLKATASQPALQERLKHKGEVAERPRQRLNAH